MKRNKLILSFEPRTRDDKTSFYKKLQEMVYGMRDIRASATKRSRRPVSIRTADIRTDELFRMFKVLIRTLGYKIESPHGLKSKHVEALVEYWRKEGLAVSTVVNRLSVLRVFCEMTMQKSGMVRPAVEYWPGAKRTRAAQYDKSLSAKVDPVAFIRRARLIDERIAVQLWLCFEFGLRVNEVLQLKPIECDRGRFLYLLEGTKGGRPRPVDIVSVGQREALDAAKAFASLNPKGFVSKPRHALATNRNHFYRVCRQLGLTKKDIGATAHSLRHNFLQSVFEDITGVPAPVKRSYAERVPGGPVLSGVPPEILERAQLEVANLAGHNRKSTAGAYLGSIPQALKAEQKSYQFINGPQMTMPKPLQPFPSQIYSAAVEAARRRLSTLSERGTFDDGVLPETGNTNLVGSSRNMYVENDAPVDEGFQSKYQALEIRQGEVLIANIEESI